MIEIKDKIIDYLISEQLTCVDCDIHFHPAKGYFIESKTLSEKRIEELNLKIKEIE